MHEPENNELTNRNRKLKIENRKSQKKKKRNTYDFNTLFLPTTQLAPLAAPRVCWSHSGAPRWTRGCWTLLQLPWSHLFDGNGVAVGSTHDVLSRVVMSYSTGSSRTSVIDERGPHYYKVSECRCEGAGERRGAGGRGRGGECTNSWYSLTSNSGGSTLAIIPTLHVAFLPHWIHLWLSAIIKC